MNRPTFGQVCKVYAIAKKIREEKDGKLMTRYVRRIIAPKEGIYIGYRNVHEGDTKTINERGEYGTVLGSYHTFTHTSSRVVWVIAFNDKEKPVYVFPEDVR